MQRVFFEDQKRERTKKEKGDTPPSTFSTSGGPAGVSGTPSFTSSYHPPTYNTSYRGAPDAYSDHSSHGYNRPKDPDFYSSPAPETRPGPERFAAKESVKDTEEQALDEEVELEKSNVLLMGPTGSGELAEPCLIMESVWISKYSCLVKSNVLLMGPTRSG